MRQQKRRPSQRKEEMGGHEMHLQGLRSLRKPGPPQDWISRASGRCKVRLNFKRPFSLLCGGWIRGLSGQS